jgi:hypothetical protein
LLQVDEKEKTRAPDSPAHGWDVTVARTLRVGGVEVVAQPMAMSRAATNKLQRI